MNKLIQYDDRFISSINDTYTQLIESHEKMLHNYSFDLSKIEVTEAILIRLKSYYQTQQKIKLFLNKRYLTAGADFFVESVLFFTKLFLKTSGSNLEVHSERQIKKEKNSIRPDISIWDGDEVVAIIECKTQLGWNRDNWENQFIERELKLKKDFPNAKSFLLVMTGSNWPGFIGNPNLNSSYFCILKDKWPIDYDDNSQILSPIEGLLNQLIN